MEIIKKFLAIVIFFISLYWGIIGVCWGRVIYGLIAVYLNSYYTKRLINISLSHQVKDILVPLGQSLLMGLCVIFFSSMCHSSIVLKLTLSIFIGFLSYLIIIGLTGKKYCAEIIPLVKTIINKTDFQK